MAKEFSCTKCGRKFSMAAHLARHMSSHGAKSTKKKAAKKTGRRRGRPPGSKNKARSVSRSIAGINLGAMHLHELTDLIDAARAEARIKLRELEASLA